MKTLFTQICLNLQQQIEVDGRKIQKEKCNMKGHDNPY